MGCVVCDRKVEVNEAISLTVGRINCKNCGHEVPINEVSHVLYAGYITTHDAPNTILAHMFEPIVQMICPQCGMKIRSLAHSCPMEKQVIYANI